MLLRISFFNVCENFFDFKLLILLINSLGLLGLRIKCLALGGAQFLITPILVPKMGIRHAYASIAGLGIPSLTPVTSNKSVAFLNWGISCPLIRVFFVASFIRLVE